MSANGLAEMRMFECRFFRWPLARAVAVAPSNISPEIRTPENATQPLDKHRDY
jgi:hypothetical protein